MSTAGELSPAEQHLGEALAALVDGELRHDARDRVLAHLATCPRCKAEADAQRRLKSVFSAAAPPAPSDGLLARLQGLPGVDLDDPGGNPFRDEPRRRGSGVGLFTAPAPAAAATAAAGAAGALDTGRGFRIHEVDRPAARGRRFAFAAAGAVSFAALALGGSLPVDAVEDPGGSPAVTPGDGGGTPASYSPLSSSGGAQGVSEEPQPLVRQDVATGQQAGRLPADGLPADGLHQVPPPLLPVVSVTPPPAPAAHPTLSGTNAPNLR